MNIHDALNNEILQCSCTDSLRHLIYFDDTGLSAAYMSLVHTKAVESKFLKTQIVSQTSLLVL